MGPTYELSNLPTAMEAAIKKEYSRVLVNPNIQTS